MPNHDKALDGVKSIMASAVLELRDLIDNNPNQRVNFVETLCMFLHGIIENTADLAEVSSPEGPNSIFIRRLKRGQGEVGWRPFMNWE